MEGRVLTGRETGLRPAGWEKDWAQNGRPGERPGSDRERDRTQTGTPEAPLVEVRWRAGSDRERDRAQTGRTEARTTALESSTARSRVL